MFLGRPEGICFARLRMCLTLFFAESGSGMLKRVEVSVNQFQSVVLDLRRDTVHSKGRFEDVKILLIAIRFLQHACACSVS